MIYRPQEQIFLYQGDRVEIKVTAKNGQLTDATQETIRAKVAKLPKFFVRTTAIQVIADLSHSEKPKVEIIVSAEETNDFFASDSGSNVIVALDSTISKVEQQMKKHKEKLVSHRNRDHKIVEEPAE
jgi:putative sigma-54 modulation protein